MASIPVTLNGVLYPKGKSASDQPIPVTFVGEAWYSGLEVGGGPMPGGPPLGIWGPTDPRPTPPIYWPGFPGQPPGGGGQPPVGIWPNPPEGQAPIPSHPIVLPTPPLPPDVEQPSPGDPPVVLPPPAGSPGWPVHPMTPPPYVVINYPGVGPIVVAPPQTSATTPPAP